MQQSAGPFLILTLAIDASNPNPNPNTVIRDQFQFPSNYVQNSTINCLQRLIDRSHVATTIVWFILNQT